MDGKLKRDEEEPWLKNNNKKKKAKEKKYKARFCLFFQMELF